MNRIFYMGFIFLFISCKKDAEPVPVAEDPCAKFYYRMTDDVSEANFKTNTYWVLYDSITQVYDSIIVTQCYTYNQELPTGKHTDGCTPYDLRTKQYLKHYVYFSGSPATLVTSSDFYSFTISEKVIFLKSDTDCLTPPYYLFGTRIYYDYPSSAADISEHSFRSEHDSLFVYNTYYKKCIKTSFTKNHPYDLFQVKDKKEIIFNTEYGLLKIKRFDSLNNVASCKVIVRHNILK